MTKEDAIKIIEEFEKNEVFNRSYEMQTYHQTLIFRFYKLYKKHKLQFPDFRSRLFAYKVIKHAKENRLVDGIQLTNKLLKKEEQRIKRILQCLTTTTKSSNGKTNKNKHPREQKREVL